MLIIFDCDGVLVDSEPLAAEALSGVMARAGVAVGPAEIMTSYVGLKLTDILASIERGQGRPLAEGFAETVWPATRAIFADRLRAMPGVADFLRASAAPRCVASSSSPERIRFSLETTGLLAFFEPHLFSSTMVLRGKPAPDLFLHAARAMRADPAQCLVIEDSVAGVTGAAAAGMRVIGFTGGGHAGPDLDQRLESAGAARTVRSWASMAETLREVGFAPG